LSEELFSDTLFRPKKLFVENRAQSNLFFMKSDKGFICICFFDQPRNLTKTRGSGGTTRIRSLPRNTSAEELHGDSTVKPRPKVWTRDQRWKKY